MKKLILLSIVCATFALSQSEHPYMRNPGVDSLTLRYKSASNKGRVYLDSLGRLVFKDITGQYLISDFGSTAFGSDSVARTRTQPQKTFYVSPTYSTLSSPYFSSLRSAATAVSNTSGYTIQMTGVDTTLGTIIFTNADSLTIVGYGAERYLPSTADGAITMLRFKDCDHLQLLGFTLDGRAPTRTGTYGSGGNSKNGILIETVSQDSTRDILIKDVTVKGMFGDGIYIHDADNVKIIENTVDSCAESILLFVGSNGFVHHNTIGQTIDQDGIELSAWSIGEVSSNQFTSNVWNSNDAIDIFDHCSDIKVLNNYVKPSTSNAATGSIIIHQGNNRVRVSGNTTGTMLLAQTDATTAESNVEYDHNTIINTSTNYGLLINRDSLSGLGYWNFHHNTIYSNNGIYLRGKGTGVSISDNELYPITPGSGVGISLDQVATYRPVGVTITDNKFHAQNYGIWYLFTSSLDTASITGNHFFNIATATRIVNQNNATIGSNVTQYGNDGATSDVFRHLIAKGVYSDTAQVGEYTINSIGAATRTVGSTTTNVVDAKVQRDDLITNGSFTGSLTPWAQSGGSAWSYSSNQAVYSEADNAYLGQTTADTIRPTITYRLTFTISSCTDSAQITFSTGITFMKAQSWYKNGTYTIFFTNNSGTEIRIAPNTTSVNSAFHIDDVSLIPLQANEGDILINRSGLWANEQPAATGHTIMDAASNLLPQRTFLKFSGDGIGSVTTVVDTTSVSIPGATGYIPDSRTITINGTADQITSSAGAQDLSANRTWTLSLPSNMILPGTGGTTLPIGTTAQRPSVSAGIARYNSTLGWFDFYEGSNIVNYLPRSQVRDSIARVITDSLKLLADTTGMGAIIAAGCKPMTYISHGTTNDTLKVRSSCTDTAGLGTSLAGKMDKATIRTIFQKSIPDTMYTTDTLQLWTIQASTTVDTIQYDTQLGRLITARIEMVDSMAQTAGVTLIDSTTTNTSRNKQYGGLINSTTLTATKILRLVWTTLTTPITKGHTFGVTFKGQW